MGQENTPPIRIRVTILLRRNDGRICFVRHFKHGNRYWLLPGGGQNPFESLQEAAKRELVEELGIKVEKFSFIALRETFCQKEGRHIQFPILEGIDPDFSTLGKSNDPRVEGTDFFNAGEIQGRPIYPSFNEDLFHLFQNESIPLFRTLEWVS